MATSSFSGSRALPWKISTFAALGLAGFFAVRAPHGAAAATSAAGVGAGPSETPARASGGGGGWLPGWLAAPPPVESGTSKALVQLRSAKSPSAICEALTELGTIGDEASVAAIAEYAGKPRTSTRACAVTALGQSNTGGARSWLVELLGDKDADIRAAAVTALAVHAADPENRSALFAAAHTATPDVRTAALAALGNAHIPEAAPLILEALKKADPATEATLVAALGESHDPSAMPELMRRVKEGTPAQRSAALAALGGVGDGAAGVLGDILSTGSRDDVRVAANALAQMGDGPAHDALMAAASSGRPEVARAALQALNESDGDDVHDLMVKQLTSTDPQAVGTAASYFGSHHEEAALPTLHDLALHGGREANEAVAAIASVGGDAARTALAEIAGHPGTSQGTALQQLAAIPGTEEQTRALSLRLLHQGGQAASTAVDVLGSDTSAEGRDALVRVVHGGGNLATSAISALARRGDSESMRAITDLARSGKNRDLRMQALSSLGSTNDPHAASTLLDALRDTDPAVRRVAVQGLASIGGPEAERAVTQVATAGATEPRARVFAVSALGRMGTPEANRQLETLTADKDNGIARTALYALARTAPESAAKVASHAMSTGDAQAKLVAVQISNQLDQDSMKSILMAGVKDEDPNVLEASARALGQIGGPDAQRALADILTSSTSTEEARHMAADVLDEMGGDGVQRYKTEIGKYKSNQSGGGDDGDSSGDVDVE
jgi:HEAT repeat protein